MKIIYLLILTSLLISSCNSGLDEKLIADNDDFEENSNTSISNSNHQKIVKKIFYNVPSPLEISSLLKSIGAEYNPTYLHSYKKANSYTTTRSMALNLGVYGADLSYNRLYNQTQASVNYFVAVKTLSDNLNIPEEQGGNTAERLESNLENKDSLLIIISQTYSNADEYLKESEKGNLAALIIFAGWIEALHIGIQIAEDSEENYYTIINNIAEQKFSLNNLIHLLNVYNNDDDIIPYINKLEELKIAYDKVEINYTRSKISTNNDKGIMTIENKSSIIISNETFDEIKVIIKNVRARIIL